MTTFHLSRDQDHDEPVLAASRGVIWVGAAIAVLFLGGAASAAVLLTQSDHMANQWISHGDALRTGVR